METTTRKTQKQVNLERLEAQISAAVRDYRGSHRIDTGEVEYIAERIASTLPPNVIINSLNRYTTGEIINKLTRQAVMEGEPTGVEYGDPKPTQYLAIMIGIIAAGMIFLTWLLTPGGLS